MSLLSLLKLLRAAGKPVSRSHVYTYLRELGISQAGARQRPARFPADTAARILAHLGIEPIRQKSFRVPSMSELRNQKTKGKK